MNLNEIIKKQRGVYLRQLDEFWTGKRGAKELLIAYNSDSPVTLLNLTRLDYVEKVGEDTKIEELSPDTYINHEMAEFTAEHFTIELNPFYWHSCEFILNKELTDLSAISTWAKYWIDEDEIFKESVEGYCNAIHSVTIPEIFQNTTRFSVDFGTSGIDCFMELVTKIKESGVERITINSFDLLR